MAEATNNNGSPPATNGGITLEQIQQTIAAAVKPLAEAQAKLTADLDVVARTMAEEAKPAAGAAAGGAGGKKEEAPAGLTLEQVKGLLDERDKKASDSAGRTAFIARTLGKLPTAYQGQLGQDPAKWDAEAKSIQSQFETDAKAMGVKLENLGTPAGDGGKTPAAEKPDLSKIPAFELLHMGVERLPVPTAAVAPAEAAK